MTNCAINCLIINCCR